MLASPWHHSGYTAGDFFVSVMFGVPAWVHFCLFIQLLYIVFIAHNELHKVLITPCGIALPPKSKGAYSITGEPPRAAGEEARYYRSRWEVLPHLGDFHRS